MRQIRTDLWETEAESPFAGLTTHAYLWRSPTGANVLFYSLVSDAQLDDLAALGGVDHQYLSHQDEAGPMLVRLGDRFGSVLHASQAELEPVGRFRAPAVTWADRHVDEVGIEVIPTPGHSIGSTCFVVPGVDGERYLFTGDTLFIGRSGRWHAGLIGDRSDPEALAASLEVIGALRPDVVASSAFAGDAGVHEVDADAWPATVEEVRRALPAPAPR